MSDEKAMIIGSGFSSAEAAYMVHKLSEHSLASIGHVDIGKTTLSVDEVAVIKNFATAPIPITPLPLSTLSDIGCSPQVRPSKHRNSKAKKRKPKGKPTHRKK